VVEIDDAVGLIDRRRLHGGDLMLAKSLAHHIEPARRRCVAKRLLGPLRTVRTDSRRLRKSRRSSWH
jgi:hypothetical protein